MDTTWLKGWSIPHGVHGQEYRRDMEKHKVKVHKLIE